MIPKELKFPQESQGRRTPWEGKGRCLVPVRRGICLLQREADSSDNLLDHHAEKKPRSMKYLDQGSSVTHISCPFCLNVNHRSRLQRQTWDHWTSLMFPLQNMAKLNKSPLPVFHYLSLPFAVYWGWWLSPACKGCQGPRSQPTTPVTLLLPFEGWEPGLVHHVWLGFAFKRRRFWNLVSRFGGASAHGTLFYVVTSSRFLRCIY